jgi:small subunit ribosomal protein S17
VAERETAKKTKIGVVKSNKMQKTVVVTVEKSVKHPLYKKILKRTKSLKAHDENNKCQIGDQVLIAETRPLSKDKCWRVVEILKSAS